MATVDKTFSFAADAETLTDQGASGIIFAFEAGDGNPAGCVKFTQTQKNTTQSEWAIQVASTFTWEDWGVPAGATVTDVQLLSIDRKLVANTKLSSHFFVVRVVDGAEASILSGDLRNLALGTTIDSVWATVSAGTLRTVNAGSQASSTPVRLWIQYQVSTSAGGGGASVDQRFDNAVLRITYTAGATPLTKDLADTITLSDTVSRSGEVVKADAITLTDQFTPTWTAVLAMSDTLSLSDELIVNLILALQLADTITLSDATAMGIGQALADSLGVSDAFGAADILSQADTLTLSEAIAQYAGLSAEDALALTDSLTRSLGVQRADTITLSDVIDPVLSAGNNLTLNLADTITLADAVVKALGLGREDTIALVDDLARAVNGQFLWPEAGSHARQILLHKFGIY